MLLALDEFLVHQRLPLKIFRLAAHFSEDENFVSLQNTR